MQFHKSDTALVIIDPQNDVLSETGVSWGLVGASIRENNTVENLERLFKTAKEQDFGVFISPHYLYPHDQAWGESCPKTTCHQSKSSWVNDIPQIESPTRELVGAIGASADGHL